MEKRLTRLVLPPLVTFLLVISCWELLVQLLAIPHYILPAPHQIIRKLVELRATLWSHASITLQEAIGGFLLGNAVGILVAIVFAHSPVFHRSLMPYAVASQTTPIVVIAPLVMLWFGFGLFSKIILAAFISIFPAVINTTKGLTSVDPQALDLMKICAFNRWQVFYKLRLPTALPYIFSAFKISTTLSVIGAIVGEFVGSNQGLGYLVVLSSYRLETDFLFAAIFVSALMGVLFFLAAGLAEYLFLRDWHESEVEAETR